MISWPYIYGHYYDQTKGLDNVALESKKALELVKRYAAKNDIKEEDSDGKGLWLLLRNGNLHKIRKQFKDGKDTVNLIYCLPDYILKIKPTDIIWPINNTRYEFLGETFELDLTLVAFEKVLKRKRTINRFVFKNANENLFVWDTPYNDFCNIKIGHELPIKVRCKVPEKLDNYNFCENIIYISHCKCMTPKEEIPFKITNMDDEINEEQKNVLEELITKNVQKLSRNKF